MAKLPRVSKHLVRGLKLEACVRMSGSQSIKLVSSMVKKGRTCLLVLELLNFMKLELQFMSTSQCSILNTQGRKLLTSMKISRTVLVQLFLRMEVAFLIIMELAN